MTPAIVQAESAGIAFEVHRYEGGSGAGYGEQAAAALGVPPERVFKTLVARLDDGRLVVAVIPVDRELDLKRLAAVAGARRAGMAAPRDAERATGYVLGGISPLGQRQRLATFLDESAVACPSVFVSAGRRGLELELDAAALQQACGARVAAIARGRKGG